jgi:hypothetical protein
MRRTTITLTAGLMLLALAPASALARHHHRRHHSRARHARVERFGRDATNAPTSSSSTDNAGTVQSFSGGVLTILLADGSTASGAVTNDTELECMASEGSQTIHADGDGGSGEESGSDENQAQGSDDQSSGEDQGDAAAQNQDQGEDQNENEAQNNCSSADLTHGTVVREAELRISGSGNTWKKVELGS